MYLNGLFPRNQCVFPSFIFVRPQRCHSKCVSEPTFYRLVQSFAVVLFEWVHEPRNNLCSLFSCRMWCFCACLTVDSVWWVPLKTALLFSGVTKWTTTTQPRTSWPCASRTTTTVEQFFTALLVVIRSVRLVCVCQSVKTVATGNMHLLIDGVTTTAQPWGQFLSSSCCCRLVSASCKQQVEVSSLSWQHFASQSALTA